jgi:hypothetical protein
LNKTEKGAAKKLPKAKTQVKNTQGNGNNPLRKSLNITEEALAIGKVPPEEVAR